eukprot:SAG11_NODE_1532_length_4732_cov_4.721563_7_plen_40_part_00
MMCPAFVPHRNCHVMLVPERTKAGLVARLSLHDAGDGTR